MPSSLQISASLPWLLRFRWLAILGQLVALLVAERALATPVAWPWAIGIVGLSIASNAVLTQAALAGVEALTRRFGPLTRILGLVLSFDTLLLTGLLLASGGPTNPFTILYLVYIVLAALVLETRWTSWLALLSALSFGSLFVFSGHEALEAHGGHGVHTMPETPAADHAGHDHVGHADHGTPTSDAADLGPAVSQPQHSYSEHLTGMWIAFAVAAVTIAYFVRQISRTLEQQREQIERLRERALNARHLASLTTLSAGAAHELRTPLATIAVAAHELERRLGADAASDLTLIGLEVERCQEILSAMGPDFDEQLHARASTSASEIARLVVERTRAAAGPGVALELDLPTEDTRVACVRAQAVQALERIVSNALDAFSETTLAKRVVVSVRREGDCAVFRVDDTGQGMDPETLLRATTPFFTTKEPGRGMGLGLFLVNAFALSVGGELRLGSTPGAGVRAELVVPLDSRAALPNPRARGALA